MMKLNLVKLAINDLHKEVVYKENEIENIRNKMYKSYGTFLLSYFKENNITDLIESNLDSFMLDEPVFVIEHECGRFGSSIIAYSDFSGLVPDKVALFANNLLKNQEIISIFEDKLLDLSIAFVINNGKLDFN